MQDKNISLEHFLITKGATKKENENNSLHLTIDKYYYKAKVIVVCTDITPLTASEEKEKPDIQRQMGIEGGVWKIIEPEGNLAHYGVWKTGTSYAKGAHIVSDLKLYEAQNAGTSGTMPPIHDKDGEIQSDGTIYWLYLNRGYGFIKDIKVLYSKGGELSFTGTISQALPPSMKNREKYTVRWAEGAFSAKEGFPAGGVIFKRRMHLFKGSTIYASAIEEYSNFDDIPKGTNFGYKINLESRGDITWMYVLNFLVIGTRDAVYNSAQDGATVFPYIVQSVYETCSDIEPLVIEERIMFTVANRNTIKSIVYNLEKSGMDSRDLSMTMSHLVSHKIRKIIKGKYPMNNIYVLTEDNRLFNYVINGASPYIAYGGQEVKFARDVVPIDIASSEMGEIYVVFRHGNNECSVGSILADYEEVCLDRFSVANEVDTVSIPEHLKPYSEICAVGRKDGKLTTLGCVKDGQELKEKYDELYMGLIFESSFTPHKPTMIALPNSMGFPKMAHYIKIWFQLGETYGLKVNNINVSFPSQGNFPVKSDMHQIGKEYYSEIVVKCDTARRCDIVNFVSSIEVE